MENPVDSLLYGFIMMGLALSLFIVVPFRLFMNRLPLRTKDQNVVCKCPYCLLDVYDYEYSFVLKKKQDCYVVHPLTQHTVKQQRAHALCLARYEHVDISLKEDQAISLKLP